MRAARPLAAVRSCFTPLFDRLMRLREAFAVQRTRRPYSQKPDLEILEDRELLDGRPLPSPIIAVGSGAGVTPLVKVYSGDTGAELYEFQPFASTFTGGVRVATGDLTGDGFPDIVVSGGPGSAPDVKVFDGHTGNPVKGPLADVMAYDPTFTGGVNVAVGDVTGAGHNDIITGADAGGGPHVKVFDGVSGKLLDSFFAYDADFSGGVRVAAADLQGTGKADIITAPGDGGSSHIKVFDPTTLRPLAGPLGNFMAFGGGDRGGAFIAAGDVEGLGNGTSELVVGAGSDHAPEVKVYDPASGAVVRDFTAFDPSFTGGVRVASAWEDNDQYADIVTGAGPGGNGEVKVFSGATGQLLPAPVGDFYAFAGDHGGSYVASGNDPVTWNLTPSTFTATAGVQYSGTVAVGAYSGTDSLQATINWGDGSTTAGQVISSGAFAVNGAHTYPAPGVYTTTVTVSEVNNGGSVSGNGQATVTGTTQSPNPIPPNCDCPCQTGDDLGNLISTADGDTGYPQSDSTVAPVRYFDGVVKIGATDLVGSGFGMPWGQARTWSNGTGYATESGNGSGWVDSRLPTLEQVGSSLAVVSTASQSRYYDLVGSVYQPRFFDQTTLVANPPSKEFVLTDTTGAQVRFNSFDSSLPANEQGRFKSYTDPNGNVTSVTSWTTSGHAAEVQRTNTTNGTTVTESYLYSYVPSGVNAGLLQSVVQRQQTNGGSWTTVRQVQYAYYDGTYSGAMAYGNQGDLQTATVEDGAGNVIDTDYYRYWTPSDISGGGHGYVHGLKYVFTADSYGRLQGALGGSGNPLLASDSTVSPYANNYFEYDSHQRVTKEIAQGQGCSACSGGLGTFTFSYTASTNSPGYNSWAMKTVVTLPDGNQNIVYTNAYGEVMLNAYRDTTLNPTGDPTKDWVEYTKFDSQGRNVFDASASAVNGYNDSFADVVNWSGSSAQYLRASSGLITLRDYYSSTTAGETTAGGAAGYLQDVKLDQGTGGTPVLQETRQYYQHSFGTSFVDPLATDTVYRNTDGTGAETTSHAYTWYSGTAEMQSDTVTRPVISAAENGPGVADVNTTFFDGYGRPVWTKDGDGFINYTAYDQLTGAVVTSISDVNTSLTGEFTNLPSGWSTPTGGGLNLITTDQVDRLGRTVKMTDPNGNVTYIVYNDPQHEVLTYVGWNTTTNAPTGPTQVYREDRQGGFTETFTMSATPHLTGGVPDGTEAVSAVQTLSRDIQNAAGQMVEQDDYFNLTGVTYANGATNKQLGTAGTNFYATLYAYDTRGWENKVVSPTGTITRMVHDGLGRLISTWVGTNDTPGSGYWSPTNNTSPSNMVDVEDRQYDNGGVGDGNLTQVTQHPGGGQADRVTQSVYDWRDRLIATKGGVQSSEDTTTHRPITYLTYNNLNEVTKTQRYDGDTVQLSSLGSTNGVPNAPSASLLQAQTVTSYDDQGRVYQTQVYDVNPSTGAVSASALTTNDYYDHRGDLIAESAPGGLWTKTQYDGARRAIVRSSTDGLGGTSWSAASTVSGDNVLEQMLTVYDGDGNAVESSDKQRFFEETGLGALGTPTTGPLARVYYTASYYDAANRLTGTVNVGTNGGTTWTRPATIPAASDTALVTLYAYNAAGWVQDVTDPRGLDTRTYYDNLRRTTETIEDYTDGTPTYNSNKTTSFTYDGDNHILTLTAADVSGSTTTNQTTKYIYGVGTSTISSNDLLAAVQHPDKTTGAPSASEQDSYGYNALGETVTMQDRNGNVHAYSYDVLGRQTADAVTTLGTGVDGTVRRLQTAYDTQGNAYLFTSYDSASGGNVVNQVLRTFNGLGQLTADYQSHSGAVVLGTTPVVQYAYNEMAGGENNSRLVSMTYPNGRVLRFDYASIYSIGSAVNDRISRLSDVFDVSNNVLEQAYDYLGLSTVVRQVNGSDTGLYMYDYMGGANADGGDEYTGLDRFGRVIDQEWYNGDVDAVLSRQQYGYDRDGNVVWRKDMVNGLFSEVYSYDGLNQLTGFQRGTLNATDTGISGTPSETESWTLDALGNFAGVTTNGTGVNRTNNAQNEVTSVGSTMLTYDANGNTLKDDQGITYTYDAWNRQVSETVGGTTYQIRYDAVGRRVTGVGLDGATDVYYSVANQMLETRTGTTVVSQYVWGTTYVNDLVERYTPGTGQRVFALHDANYNVTAIVDPSANVLERYVYEPYGTQTVLSASWGTLSGTQYGFDVGFQGGQRDRHSGDILFGVRIYSPTLGRFLSTDWISFGGGDQNLYRFVGDGPPARVDPKGMDWNDLYLLATNPVDTAQGMWHGAGVMTNQAAGMGYQAMAMTTDVAAYGGQGMVNGALSLAGSNQRVGFRPTSAFFQGLEQAPSSTEYVGQAAWQMARTSTGVLPIADAINEMNTTGDADAATRYAFNGAVGAIGTAGVVGVGNAVTGRLGVQALASSYRTWPTRLRPNTVATIRTPIGTFAGRSGFFVGMHPVLRRILDSLTRNSGHPGRCAEINAIDNALWEAQARSGQAIETVEQARQALQGSTIRTAQVRGPNAQNPALQGAPQAPCVTCEQILALLGIRYR